MKKKVEQNEARELSEKSELAQLKAEIVTKKEGKEAEDILA
jgi:hypothetical protein